MGRKRNIAELKTALAGYQNKRLSKKEGDLNGQGKVIVAVTSFSNRELSQWQQETGDSTLIRPNCRIRKDSYN